MRENKVISKITQAYCTEFSVWKSPPLVLGGEAQEVCGKFSELKRCLRRV